MFIDVFTPVISYILVNTSSTVVHLCMIQLCGEYNVTLLVVLVATAHTHMRGWVLPFYLNPADTVHYKQIR